MDILQAILLGIVEGLTEFLPVSSTGHLILVSTLLGLKQTEFQKTFEVVIQLGSILAVVFLYRKKLFTSFTLWKKLIIAFIPTGTIGFLLYKIIKSLFDPYIVVTMLILGGVFFIIVEILYKKEPHLYHNIEDIPYYIAFAIGFFQSFAMIPGTSRSGASIIGGLLMGLDRKTAAEFSFLLAVPTMFIATGYDVFKHYDEFNVDNWLNLIVGLITSFIFAVLSIKFLLKFISKHSFIPFGIYRIILGVVFYLVVLR